MGRIISFFAIVCILITFAAGWVMNIITLVGMNFADPITVELVLRVVGIVFFPLGVIMGYV